MNVPVGATFVIVTVASSVAVRPWTSVTWTRTVRVEGPSSDAALNVGFWPGGLERAVVVEIPRVRERVAVRVAARGGEPDGSAFGDGVRAAGVDGRRAG